VIETMKPLIKSLKASTEALRAPAPPPARSRR